MHLCIKNFKKYLPLNPQWRKRCVVRCFRKSWTQQLDRNCTWGPAGYPEDSTGLRALSQTVSDCEMGIAGTLSDILLSLLDVLGQSLSSHLGWDWRKSTGGFPGGASGKESACQCRKCKRYEFDPCIREISWRREWLPTPVLLPGKSQRSLEGYSPWGSQRVGHDWVSIGGTVLEGNMFTSQTEIIVYYAIWIYTVVLLTKYEKTPNWLMNKLPQCPQGSST